MPSYPDSVKTFTTKLDGAGNTINAAHVNDLQDEVNAIEAGLLDGTARLNSSGSTLASLSVTGGSTLSGRFQSSASTVASLSVTGGSTLAGTLQSSASTVASLSVTGGSTLAGTLQSSNSTVNALSVSSNSTFAIRPTMPPPDAVRVGLDSSVTIGSSAFSTLAWTLDTFETNSSMHSTATNPERLIPQSTGIYLAVAELSIAANSTGWRLARLLDSSNGLIGRGFESSGVDGPVVQVTGYKRFDVTGGYITCDLAVPSGISTLSLTTESWASLQKL